MMHARRPRPIRFLAALPLALIAGMPAPAASATPSCFGEPATIVGTGDDDEVVGTRGDDVIVAFGGWDRVEGRAGDDRICVGGGEDFVRGGAGADRILGSGGSDTVHGGPGPDRILTGAGAVEALFGGAGDDRMFGGAGSFDGLIGGAGDDLLDGGGGRDIAFFFDSPNGIWADLETGRAAGFGDDRLRSIEGLGGSNQDDELFGDDGSNLIVAQEGDDVVDARGSGTLAGSQADQIDGGDGDDTLIGGPGADIVTYEDAPGPIDLDLELGTATGWGSDALSGIEAAIGSILDDALRGDGQDNAFVGGEGDDLIDGRGGRDQAAYFDAFVPVDADLALGLATGWGTDTLTGIEDLTGSAFADTLSGNDGQNAIGGGSGNDELSGRGGDDVLLGGNGSDEADGGDGVDVCEAETVVACEDTPSAPAMKVVWASFGADAEPDDLSHPPWHVTTIRRSGRGPRT
jgi:Ca2+-binding RTX toxin-like protein